LVEAGTRGEIFGSPLYIAPEQAISSANATLQSDLYSAGVILYEMLTGHVPFTADNPLDVAMLHMTEPPRPPSQLNSPLTPTASIATSTVTAPASPVPSATYTAQPPATPTSWPAGILTGTAASTPTLMPEPAKPTVPQAFLPLIMRNYRARR
jgi:serine/threonine protein kinase